LLRQAPQQHWKCRGAAPICKPLPLQARQTRITMLLINTLEAAERVAG